MERHISLRVPRHDSGWTGCVCSYPSENQSCLQLKNIYENRDDKLEEECRECELCRLECAKQIPCLREGGAFMSPEEISVMVEHPYTGYGYETHKHLFADRIKSASVFISCQTVQMDHETEMVIYRRLCIH